MIVLCQNLSNVLTEIVNQFHSVTLVYQMVVMLLFNVQAINLIYVLMENVLVIKTSVKYNLLAHMINHSDVKIKLVLQVRQNVILNQSVQSIKLFFVHPVSVPNIHMNAQAQEQQNVQLISHLNVLVDFVVNHLCSAYHLIKLMEPLTLHQSKVIIGILDVAQVDHSYVEMVLVEIIKLIVKNFQVVKILPNHIYVTMVLARKTNTYVEKLNLEYQNVVLELKDVKMVFVEKIVLTIMDVHLINHSNVQMDSVLWMNQNVLVRVIVLLTSLSVVLTIFV